MQPAWDVTLSILAFGTWTFWGRLTTDVLSQRRFISTVLPCYPMWLPFLCITMQTFTGGIIMSRRKWGGKKYNKSVMHETVAGKCPSKLMVRAWRVAFSKTFHWQWTQSQLLDLVCSAEHPACSNTSVGLQYSLATLAIQGKPIGNSLHWPPMANIETF